MKHTYPALTMSIDDVAAFDRLLDDIPHKHAKHLAESLNGLMWRQQQANAETERLIAEAQAEIDRAAPAANEDRVGAYVDDLADRLAPPSPLDNIH